MNNEIKDMGALYQSAIALQSKGDTDGAIVIYKKILRIKPDSIEALCNLGSALHAKGQLEEAIKLYKKALNLNPQLPQIYYNLAGAQQALGLVEMARDNYARAITQKPDFIPAQFSIGMLDLQCGRTDDALTQFRRILALNPNNPDILNCIGICLKKLGDSSQALQYFQQAVAIQPNHYQALGNLALELLSRGRINDAIEINKHVLSLNPNDEKALFNSGIACKQNKSYEDAINYFRKALVINPHAAHTKLELAHTLQTVCDWRDDAFSIHSIAALVREVLDSDMEADIDLFNALSWPLKLETLLRIAQRNATKLAVTATRLYTSLNPAIYNTADRLRIGYLSPDYRNHPAIQLMGGLFNAHNQSRFDVFAYSIGPNDGSLYRHRAEADAEHFVDLFNASVEDCVNRIRSDRIHILIDLAGYTTGARPEILAARSAPIQVNYLGFAGTLGADFFDYIITDEIITPPPYQEFFQEKFAYLPHCYQINDGRDTPTDPAPTRSACGLPDNVFVFCCFNNNYKIDPDIFQAWSNILLRVPESVLWLLKGSELQMGNLRREAVAHGVDPSRIIFAEPVDKASHLARHIHADLFLDTLYYNAHTTGSDALRQGVPMITCQGNTFASRVGSSLLHAVGLDELITTSLDQYTDKAIQLAIDPTELNKIRSILIENLPGCSLLDNSRFAGSLERLYEIMWERFSKGEAPHQILFEDQT